MLKRNTSLMRKLVPVLGAAGLLLTLTAWSFASPVGASPDEDYHLISIWCADGGMTSKCELAGSTSERRVNELFTLATCYTQNPEKSARCQVDADIFSTDEQVTTSRGNFEGNYPNGFYSVLRGFASQDIESSVISMRIANSALFVAFATALWLLLPKRARVGLYFTIALTLVPLGLFIIASVNPSSWTLTGVMASFFGVAGAILTSAKRRISLSVLAALGLCLSLTSRYDGFIYALAAAVTAFVLTKTFQFSRRLFLGTIIAVVLGSALFLTLGGFDFLGKMVALAGGKDLSGGTSPIAIFAANVAQFANLWAGFSGSIGLGAQDTPMPYTTWMVAATLLWGAIFMRLRYLSPRAMTLSALVAAAMVLIPLTVLQLGQSFVGEYVQPRYIFPLLIVLCGIVFLKQRDEDKPFVARSQALLIVVGLTIAQSLAIYTNMLRYVSGISKSGSWFLDDNITSGWWWPVGPTPMTFWLLATVGFALFASLALIADSQKRTEAKSEKLELEV